MKNQGIVLLTPEFLGTAMILPEGNKVIGIQWDTMNETIKVLCDGPDFPEVPEGARIPVGAIVLEREEHSQDRFHGFIET